ncbi:MAG TPA: MFS transporter [Polyangia bacterium]|nr:MFS transporter [Polyangia bacterium]
MPDSPAAPPESSSSPASLGARLQRLPRDFVLFAIAATLYAFSQSAVNSVFNNFLNDTYSIGNFQRGLLELPREMPGFLVVFVSALLYLMSSRRLAALANLLGGLGIAGVALFSPRYGVMLAWLFLFSVGQHLFMPLIQSITMEFASEGQAGRRLGQITGASNLAGIAGSLLILVGFRSLGFGFGTAFLIAAGGLLLAALFIRTMKADRPPATRSRFVVRREYKLYYWLSILYGTRKQIFLTFSPWVLVTIFKQPTQTVASLLFVGGLIGIVFNPLLGRAIDRLGERFILMGEAVVLIFVCFGYGFSRRLFGEHTALLVAGACFILDQLMMSVGMARATYLKKIAVQPDDVSQTLMMGVSIDHVFSIIVAALGGIIWLHWGYEYVFLLGVAIACVNLVSAARVRVAR